MQRSVLSCRIAFYSISNLAPQRTPALELDPVLVTAAAFPAQEGEVSAHVTIITREDIGRQQGMTVSEILMQVTGLHVDESGMAADSVPSTSAAAIRIYRDYDRWSSDQRSHQGARRFDGVQV